MSDSSSPSSFFFDLVAGTTEFYEDPQYYDYEFKARSEDVDFYSTHYKDAEGWALEIGIGTGRIALEAVRRGARVVGLDLHKKMLDFTQKQADSLPKDQQANLRLVQGDMRTFNLEETFSVIGMPFNALQHMYTTEDALACLKQVHQHLTADGILVLDVLMPDFEYLNRSPHQRFAGIDFEHPTYPAIYNYSEQSAYDPVRQLNQMWLHYTRVKPAPNDTQCPYPKEYSIQLSHRYYFPMELNLLLETAGFDSLVRWGDFKGTELQDGAESMIYVCQKKQDQSEQ
jgi:SAM-dependent methyltransferase